jgi:hypothetical protein
MKPIPPLAALRCFEAVARLGGITATARELHVTHSAVSQQINPYWLVWQQREILNARQAHFAQWIEGQVDAYLRESGVSSPSTRAA